jgi:hypothetical protein
MDISLKDSKEMQNLLLLVEFYWGEVAAKINIRPRENKCPLTNARA